MIDALPGSVPGEPRKRSSIVSVDTSTRKPEAFDESSSVGAKRRASATMSIRMTAAIAVILILVLTISILPNLRHHDLDVPMAAILWSGAWNLLMMLGIAAVGHWATRVSRNIAVPCWEDEFHMMWVLQISAIIGTVVGPLVICWIATLNVASNTT